jgi:hypothetical protein
VPMSAEGLMYSSSGTKRASLPDGVERVYLSLKHVTPSLTMLIATFEWDEYWGEALDRISHRDYATAEVPCGAGRSIYNPLNIKKIEANRCRQVMHNHLSYWLNSHLPGAFKNLEARPPILDVITCALSLPFVDGPSQLNRDYRYALSLGGDIAIGTSSYFPGLRLNLPRYENRKTNVLTLAGRTSEVDAFNEYKLQYGDEVVRSGLYSNLGDHMDDLVCSWASVRLLYAMEKDLSSLRDLPPLTSCCDSRHTRDSQIASDVFILKGLLLYH